MARFDVAAVVVTYKTADLLRGCLRSLCDEAAGSGLKLRITVVDNASHDGTAEMVAQEFPAVRLLVNEENVGPARAFNRGIADALGSAAYILVSNSDIEVLPGTLGAMHAFMRDNPGVDGVCGPLLNEDRSRQPSKTHIWNLRAPNWEKRFRVDFVGTTFALIRAEAFRRLGGYDENYYFYNEDLDWAERAKRAKCLFMYLPEAPVVHFGSRGSRQNKSRITRELYWSNIYYYKKFYPRLAWLAHRLLTLELRLRLRRLRRIAPIADETTAADLEEAERRLHEEYRQRRTPKVPDWSWQ